MKQNRRSFLKSSATATSAALVGLINTPGVVNADTTAPGTTQPQSTTNEVTYAATIYLSAGHQLTAFQTPTATTKSGALMELVDALKTSPGLAAPPAGVTTNPVFHKGNNYTVACNIVKITNGAGNDIPQYDNAADVPDPAPASYIVYTTVDGKKRATLHTPGEGAKTIYIQWLKQP